MAKNCENCRYIKQISPLEYVGHGISCQKKAQKLKEAANDPEYEYQCTAPGCLKKFKTPQALGSHLRYIHRISSAATATESAEQEMQEFPLLTVEDKRRLQQEGKLPSAYPNDVQRAKGFFTKWPCPACNELMGEFCEFKRQIGNIKMTCKSGRNCPTFTVGGKGKKEVHEEGKDKGKQKVVSEEELERSELETKIQALTLEVATLQCALSAIEKAQKDKQKCEEAASILQAELVDLNVQLASMATQHV